MNLTAETATSLPPTGVEQPRSSYQEVSDDARLADSLRIGLKFLCATNRVDTRDDGFVNLDSFLHALCIVEGRKTPHIDAYDAASADPSLKIANKSHTPLY